MSRSNHIMRPNDSPQDASMEFTKAFTPVKIGSGVSDTESTYSGDMSFTNIHKLPVVNHVDSMSVMSGSSDMSMVSASSAGMMDESGQQTGYLSKGVDLVYHGNEDGLVALEGAEDANDETGSNRGSAVESSSATLYATPTQSESHFLESRVQMTPQLSESETAVQDKTVVMIDQRVNGQQQVCQDESSTLFGTMIEAPLKNMHELSTVLTAAAAVTLVSGTNNVAPTEVGPPPVALTGIAPTEVAHTVVNNWQDNVAVGETPVHRRRRGVTTRYAATELALSEAAVTERAAITVVGLESSREPTMVWESPSLTDWTNNKSEKTTSLRRSARKSNNNNNNNITAPTPVAQKDIVSFDDDDDIRMKDEVSINTADTRAKDLTEEITVVWESPSQTVKTVVKATEEMTMLWDSPATALLTRKSVEEAVTPAKSTVKKGAVRKSTGKRGAKNKSSSNQLTSDEGDAIREETAEEELIASFDYSRKMKRVKASAHNTPSRTFTPRWAPARTRATAMLPVPVMAASTHTVKLHDDDESENELTGDLDMLLRGDTFSEQILPVQTVPVVVAQTEVAIDTYTDVQMQTEVLTSHNDMDIATNTEETSHNSFLEGENVILDAINEVLLEDIVSGVVNSAIDAAIDDVISTTSSQVNRNSGDSSANNSIATITSTGATVNKDNDNHVSTIATTATNSDKNTTTTTTTTTTNNNNTIHNDDLIVVDDEPTDSNHITTAPSISTSQKSQFSRATSSDMEVTGVIVLPTEEPSIAEQYIKQSYQNTPRASRSRRASMTPFNSKDVGFNGQVDTPSKTSMVIPFSMQDAISTPKKEVGTPASVMATPAKSVVTPAKSIIATPAKSSRKVPVRNIIETADTSAKNNVPIEPQQTPQRRSSRLSMLQNTMTLQSIREMEEEHSYDDQSDSGMEETAVQTTAIKPLNTVFPSSGRKTRASTGFTEVLSTPLKTAPQPRMTPLKSSVRKSNVKESVIVSTNDEASVNTESIPNFTAITPTSSRGSNDTYSSTARHSRKIGRRYSPAQSHLSVDNNSVVSSNMEFTEPLQRAVLEINSDHDDDAVSSNSSSMELTGVQQQQLHTNRLNNSIFSEDMDLTQNNTPVRIVTVNNTVKSAVNSDPVIVLADNVEDEEIRTVQVMNAVVGSSRSDSGNNKNIMNNTLMNTSNSGLSDDMELTRVVIAETPKKRVQSAMTPLKSGKKQKLNNDTSIKPNTVTTAAILTDNVPSAAMNYSMNMSFTTPLPAKPLASRRPQLQLSTRSTQSMFAGSVASAALSAAPNSPFKLSERSNRILQRQDHTQNNRLAPIVHQQNNQNIPQDDATSDITDLTHAAEDVEEEEQQVHTVASPVQSTQQHSVVSTNHANIRGERTMRTFVENAFLNFRSKFEDSDDDSIASSVVAPSHVSSSHVSNNSNKGYVPPTQPRSSYDAISIASTVRPTRQSIASVASSSSRKSVDFTKIDVDSFYNQNISTVLDVVDLSGDDDGGDVGSSEQNTSVSSVEEEDAEMEEEELVNDSRTSRGNTTTNNNTTTTGNSLSFNISLPVEEEVEDLQYSDDKQQILTTSSMFGEFIKVCDLLTQSAVHENSRRESEHIAKTVRRASSFFRGNGDGEDDALGDGQLGGTLHVNMNALREELEQACLIVSDTETYGTGCLTLLELTEDLSGSCSEMERSVDVRRPGAFVQLQQRTVSVQRMDKEYYDKRDDKQNRRYPDVVAREVFLALLSKLRAEVTAKAGLVWLKWRLGFLQTALLTVQHVCSRLQDDQDHLETYRGELNALQRVEAQVNTERMCKLRSVIVENAEIIVELETQVQEQRSELVAGELRAQEQSRAVTMLESQEQEARDRELRKQSEALEVTLSRSQQEADLLQTVDYRVSGWRSAQWASFGNGDSLVIGNTAVYVHENTHAGTVMRWECPYNSCTVQLQCTWRKVTGVFVAPAQLQISAGAAAHSLLTVFLLNTIFASTIQQRLQQCSSETHLGRTTASLNAMLGNVASIAKEIGLGKVHQVDHLCTVTQTNEHVLVRIELGARNEPSKNNVLPITLQVSNVSTQILVEIQCQLSHRYPYQEMQFSAKVFAAQQEDQYSELLPHIQHILESTGGYGRLSKIVNKIKQI